MKHITRISISILSSALFLLFVFPTPVHSSHTSPICQTSPTPTPTPIIKSDCDHDGDLTDTTEAMECLTPTPILSDTPLPATPSATSTPGPIETSSSVLNTGATPTAPGVCAPLGTDTVPANFHVYRLGILVLAKWVPDQSFPQVILWYGHNGKGIQYSTIRGNTGYEFITVYDFGNYTFWASYKKECSVGNITHGPVIDSATSYWRLFRQSP